MVYFYAKKKHFRRIFKLPFIYLSQGAFKKSVICVQVRNFSRIISKTKREHVAVLLFSFSFLTLFFTILPFLASLNFIIAFFYDDHDYQSIFIFSAVICCYVYVTECFLTLLKHLVIFNTYYKQFLLSGDVTHVIIKLLYNVSSK